jgi:hypothetical protein
VEEPVDAELEGTRHARDRTRRQSAVQARAC